MKREITAFCFGLLAAVWVGLFFNVNRPAKRFFPTVQAQEPPVRGRECANALLLGTYALTLEGQTITGSSAGPYAAIGVMTFDGQGGAALVGTQSYNGNILFPSNFAGRYLLSTDCAGSIVFNTGARFDLVTDNGGRQVNLLQTNQGSVVTGIARKQ